MPRRRRVFVEGAIYHVYNRFARDADLFADPEEAIRFLEILRKARDRDGLRILAWCLMSNHYHLAVRTGPVPLSRTMGFVQSRFGQRYNRSHRSSGPRWQSRYKAKLVEDARYADQLMVYIHLNPVVAGLVDDPAQYPFCGHRELMGKVREPLIDVDGVLAGFGDTVRAARRAYVRALKGAREVEWCGEAPGRLPWWRREPDRPLEPAALDAWVDELGCSTGLERKRMEAGEYLVRSCALAGIPLAAISAQRKRRDISRQRYLIAALAIERWETRREHWRIWWGDVLKRSADGRAGAQNCGKIRRISVPPTRSSITSSRPTENEGSIQFLGMTALRKTYNRAQGDFHMTIPVELTRAQEDALRAAAQRLGVSAEDLARLAVEDLLEQPRPDFEEAARRVLEKNRDLYQRLS